MQTQHDTKGAIQRQSPPIMSPQRKLGNRVIAFCLLASIFTLAYPQTSLYKSVGNQATKFFHGLADGGLGFLQGDWLASTVDPLPLFSTLVRLTYQAPASGLLFYGYRWLLLGIYLASVLGIVGYVYYRFNRSKLAYLGFIALFLASHTIRINLFEFDTAFHLHAGVAGQYILDQELQPATFGALILLSICCFLYRRYFYAVASLGLAVNFHPAYLISAALLTALYCVVLLVEARSWDKACALGATSLILVLPMVLYTKLVFAATSPEVFQRAQYIITHLRIPHHAIPSVWLADGTAYAQTAIAAVGLYLARGTRLFPVLAVPFLFGVLLTGVQVLTGNNALALLAPWRVSVFLVPLSTYLILGGVVDWCLRRDRTFVAKHRRAIARVSLAAIVVFCLIGAITQVGMLTYRDNSMPMMDFVKSQRTSGQVYLLPPESRRLRKFRFYTGVPIFVNQKSHPYKDVEVLAWQERLEKAQAIYNNDPATTCSVIAKLSQTYRLTHVIFERDDRPLPCPALQSIYQDDKYRVYQIQSVTATTSFQ